MQNVLCIAEYSGPDPENILSKVLGKVHASNELPKLEL
jgi:hypothetical protein